MAEWLTPRTLDLEVLGSSLARRVASIDKELYSELSLFTQVYKWVPATYCWGGGGEPCDGLAFRPGVSSNTPRQLHAKETGLRSGRLGLWLACSFYLAVSCHCCCRREEATNTVCCSRTQRPENP